MIKIAMLSTGEEVLHGDIVDTNAAWLSRRFFEEGLALQKRSTVGDNLFDLVNEMVSLSLNYDLVIVNGGLGPTSDDMSAEAAAEAAEDELELFPKWVEVMKNYFKRLGREMPESNIKQAMLPRSATIIDNPVGTACGFSIRINQAQFFFTPGVPREFKHMVDSRILPAIKSEYHAAESREVSRIFTFGLTESGISDLISHIHLPAGYEFGYRSSLPFIEIKLFGPAGEMDTRLKIMHIVYGHLGDNVVSVDEPMLENIRALLEEKQQVVSVSEQSTGGYLASWLHSNKKLADRLGSSWIMSNPVQNSLVEQDPLAAALALAAAIREKNGSDIGLATGNMLDGKVAFGLSTCNGEWGQVVELKRDYEREDLRKLYAAMVTDMLRRHLEAKPVFGEYSSVKRIRELFVPASAL
ncbi:competence/damage-inducible protein A [Vibrio sp. HA2012]|uniref:CinA family nicotinamide mononucleotide deamidase-related protein n=1 Tax=Vibrio sp. HA2012 TaxID=1971595 RepID=UPI000C2C9D0C|nr:CinA family nicotinamide mononucleotide deamidase-related protein [Vibrio sp. HA2012]PJC88026.1 competence/damage-inducible protein A [Vibrio sp. HA2012]